LTFGDVVATSITSIADAGDVTITAASTNDFLVVNASGDWVDKTPAQVRGILDVEIGIDVQAYSDDLQSLASLTTATDRLPYFSGTKTASLTTFTAFGRSLVDDADAAAGRTTLGLGTAATLASTDFVAASAVSTFGGTLIDDADAATARATLGLGTASTSNTGDFEASGAVSTHAGVTSGVHGISSFGATLVDDANAATARTTLGLGTAATSDTGDFEASGAVSTHSALISGVHGISSYGSTLLDDADAAAARTTLGLGTLATQSTIEDSYLMLIESPSDKTYIIDGRVAAARTITNFYAKTSSGTCTATLKNVTDTTTIGTISVTSTGGSAASLSNTAVTENERLSIEISSNSSSEDLELVVEYTQ